jgi:DNA-directed RNA polymerase subunit beta'
MLDSIYEKINDYGAITIRLASPEDIRSWSYGEVKKPETINYRTYRAEKDGLFCERIFGPEKDWECFCGKLKGIKHKGIVCDRCGVKITHSRVRRTRMGHINLAAPVAHIWFFKAMPNRIGGLLGMKTTSLERIIYFQDYVVVDPGDTPLKEKQLLTEDEYRQCREKYGKGFEAGMGAEAVKKLLQRLDLPKLADALESELKTTRSKQRTKDIIKRLKIAQAFIDSGNKPEWMVLEVVPVIPPDLRPLVLLDSGNFATSDLNDLYRRLINRNNRLKKLLELNAPEVIIRNEKRMLQQAVDALFDNNRCRRPVLGSNNRPLKSLTDMIKGKQGRFRENLLGKRVDYSARSVIVVGPSLKLHQCGLPKKIALELFQPFIIRRLKELGYADTIKSAKKMLERKDEEVWDILEEVIHDHPVLLNRAPTLHRMGIQAFEPILIEGNAIELHPLVCTGFNADFDGDQMAVHLPLSWEAQVEALTLMMSTNNIFSPSNGNPIIAPSQDIVLGCSYITYEKDAPPEHPIYCCGIFEVFLALAQKKADFHTWVNLRLQAGKKVLGPKGIERSRNNVYLTTCGRVVFNDILPPEMPFYNYALDKKTLGAVISDSYKLLTKDKALALLDDMKELGFKHATIAGLSFSKNDLKMPPSKETIIKETEKKVDKIKKNHLSGVITEGERYNQIIDAWTHATERIGQDLMEVLKHDDYEGKSYVNPIYLMANSGARGSLQQIRQLAGIRGLMAKPSGQIIETPIKANFREGLRVLEYFSSTHGARKGLADTALKTADSGYLTRKLVDVSQNVVVNEPDCGTLNGITKSAVFRGDKEEVPLWRQIRGRVARDTITDIITDEVIVRENDLITEDISRRVQELGYKQIRVRSPLTCETPRGICAKCYGMDLSRGQMVEAGLAVGIIAAQSIGEPGTQLTMRTFHIGGIASKRVEESEIRSINPGTIRFGNLVVVTAEGGDQMVLNRDGELTILDAKGRELETYRLPSGAILKVKDKTQIKTNTVLVQWDPHMVPVLAEQAGVVHWEDMVENRTYREEKDIQTGIPRIVIIEHKGDLHPQIIIKDRSTGDILGVYPLSEKAHLMVKPGDEVSPGTLLAKTPREITGTQDITGGLPRVTEIFEVRKPRNPAIISEIDGYIIFGEKKRGKRTVIVRSEAGMEKEHLIPHGKPLKVKAGDYVTAGTPLVEGPLVLQDILRINGEETVQQYLLTEVQKVYRSQNITIDDKHIEIIVAQMMRRIEVEKPGDTIFLPGEITDKFRFKRENEHVVKEGKKPSSAKPLLLGITKASLHSDSFISAASFQETTKILTEAAIAGKTDNLLGIKENVILGHMIPAGTGYKEYLDQKVKKVIEKTAEAHAGVK